jgi:H+/Cl- antiporter ClcA
MDKYLIFILIDIFFSIAGTEYIINVFNAKSYRSFYRLAFITSLIGITSFLIFNTIKVTQNPIELIFEVTVLPFLVILLILKMNDNLNKLSIII